MWTIKHLSWYLITLKNITNFFRTFTKLSNLTNLIFLSFQDFSAPLKTYEDLLRPFRHFQAIPGLLKFVSAFPNHFEPLRKLHQLSELLNPFHFTYKNIKAINDILGPFKTFRTVQDKDLVKCLWQSEWVTNWLTHHRAERLSSLKTVKTLQFSINFDHAFKKCKYFHTKLLWPTTNQLNFKPSKLNIPTIRHNLKV